LVCLAYSPCKVSTKISSKDIEIPIEIEELTSYPFNDKIEFNLHLVNPAAFSLKFRIPGWCTDPKIQINQESPISCKPGNFINISRDWNDNDKVILILTTNIKFERRFNNSLTIKRGSLIFSYNPEEKQKELEQKGKVYELKQNKSLKIPSQVKDWEIYPKSKWQYALIEPIEPKCIQLPDNIEQLDSFKTQHPPIILKVNAIEIKNWDLQFEAAAPPPINPTPISDKIEEIKLIPYGCTNIRITEFPTIKRENIKWEKIISKNCF
jgi:hypothetical protein